MAKESATTSEVLNSKASSRSLPAEHVTPPPADAAPAPVPEPEPEPQPAGRPGANGEKSGAVGVISYRDRAGALRATWPEEQALIRGFKTAAGPARFRITVPVSKGDDLGVDWRAAHRRPPESLPLLWVALSRVTKFARMRLARRIAM